MRWGLLVALSGAFWCVPAQAQSTVTTTAATSAGSTTAIPPEDAYASLAPFDSSLGTLTGITLQIGDYFEEPGFAFADSPPVTADITTTGTFTAKVNGVDYTVPISSEQTYNIDWFSRVLVTASGSSIFNIAPSLFSTFVSPMNPCFAGEICAIESGSSISLSDVPAGVSFDLHDFESNGSYTLTYSYIPFAVPEPSTWAMMLLGLGVVGLFARKTRAVAQIGE